MDTLEPTLPNLMKRVAETIPELKGRAFAVSEVEPLNSSSDQANLPIAYGALVNGTGDQITNGGGAVTFDDFVIIQFRYAPAKYSTAEGQDTPYYAYHDYEILRDVLLAGLDDWRSPRGGNISYQAVDVESNEFAVYITFRFKINQRYCVAVNAEGRPKLLESEGKPPRIFVSQCVPKQEYCSTPSTDEEEDPCP